ncbi:MAG: adenylate/guanylate cyclase domain-containing protein, partial [Gammaproteobacteria bacterium]|nr:adenylate/guanylate cyclase domain-containing protein [Gammaproteobacteria bacterium]
IVFAEPYEASALQLLNDLEGKLETSPEESELLASARERWDTDETFAASLIGRNVVLGYVFKDRLAPDEPVGAGMLPDPLYRADQLGALAVPFAEGAGYVAPYDMHMFAAERAGFFSNPHVDRDGIFRRVPLMQAYEGDVYSSLALSVARLALGEPPLRFVFADPDGAPLDDLNLEGLQLGERFLPVDGELNALVPYQGRSGAFEYVSVVDVLNGGADIETLFDSVVLIGTSAPGLLDLRATPVGARFVGVEIHANLVHGILNGGLKSSPQYMQGVELLALVVIAMVITLFSLLPAIWGVSALVGLVVLIFYIGLYGWQAHDLNIPVASSIGLAIGLFLLQFAYSYAVESRKKRHLSKVFGQYIPEELVADLDASEEEVSLEGENREMSVLFSDVRSFTSISEGLDPVELTQLMNEFLTPITRVIHENRGTIDKYMGDAVMAFWGAPLHDDDHAYHSVTAGMKMIEALDALQPHFKSKGWPEIKVGVGVNSGPMNVGNMGSEFRMAYTVLGDTVNLGSRLEGLTKQYGVQFIVSEITAQAAPQYLYRELDAVRVKGKQEPVRIFEPVGGVEAASEAEMEEIGLWNQVLEYYRFQQWQKAKEGLKTLAETYPERMVYDLYVERIELFEAESPGEDWDGVFTHTSK